MNGNILNILSRNVYLGRLGAVQENYDIHQWNKWNKYCPLVFTEANTEASTEAI